ncbi:YihY/virulence factor BrkB family protein [Desulfurivibrio sp. D14AmB]|uniref:YihY/virulence factor BrkB family protein n=1 Tax=Desulfurivibrio sp. D14AmB TaxID=3374370 RepID=UPI00376F131A
MSQPRAAAPQARLKQLVEAGRDWIWRPHQTEESVWQRGARDLLRVIMIFIREFDRDRIPLRAAALTFTIMLSLVPTLALGTAVLKGLGAGDQMRQAAHRFIDQMESATTLWEIPPLEKEPAAAPEKSEQATAEPGQALGSATHLRQAIDQIFDYVDRTDFATLGAFGVIGLVVAVVVVLGSIERSMNAIWHTETSRPMGRRVMDYLALMVLLPLAINLTFATEATLQSETLRQRFFIFLPVGGTEEFLLGLMPLLLLTLTFTILYRFLPNTRVKTTPALIGGLFGAIAWLVVQGIYLKLQIGVARYNAIYGSFATLPLFLIWLQVCWIIFLSGAEMAFAVQARHTYRLSDREISPVIRLTLAFAVLDIIHRNFRSRKTTAPEAMAEELGQPEEIINQVAGQLAGAGLIRWANDHDESDGYLLGTGLEKVPAAEVVDLIMGTDIPPVRGGSLVIEAMEGARQAVKARSLATFS